MKLSRTPFILAGLLIVLLSALAGEFFSKSSYDLYSSAYDKVSETPWDYFTTHPRESICYAMDHGRILSRNFMSFLTRGFGLLCGVFWLVPMVFFARRPGGNRLLRFRNFLKLSFVGMLAGIVVGALCGGGLHLYIHAMEGIRELSPAVKWGGVYVGLVFGGGAGAILGILGGWQMWAVQLAALGNGKMKQSDPSAQ